MTTKERMFKFLTDMLENNERLMYPIYGVLVQGGTRYFGYFGLTENYLLIALLSASGKDVTNTIRVPLDINSVKIKKSIILNEHLIDITFNEGPPCQISALPRVLALDTQKENLGQFLSYLESKAPQNNIPDLRQVDGIKVRKQYFNIIIYIFLAMLLPIIPMIFIVECRIQNISIWNSWNLLWEYAKETLPIIASFTVPLLLLSLGNTFIFGKTIAVIEQEGLYLDNAFIRWEDIKKIEYTPTSLSKVHPHSSYIKITVARANKQEYTMEISHFTLYGLRMLKKYLPKQAVRWTKGELASTIFMALLPTIIYILIALFK